jgi:CRISPR-associated protein Csm1
LVGNYTPKEKIGNESGDIKDFETLAGQDSQGNKLSHTRLSVMRLDVDDLGAIFAHGLDPAPSFARIASLSREFHFFFSGYFNSLAESHNIYVTYSGGDDAFVIGSWYSVMQFAKSLHKAFKKFTCNNSEVTLSAGIYNCHWHYPVAKFAEDAADLEKDAKSYPNKNRINVFNRCVTWERFEELMLVAEGLEHFVDNKVRTERDEQYKGKMSRALVQRLYAILQYAKTDEFSYYESVSRLHFLLGRNNYSRRQLNKDWQKKDEINPAQQVIRPLLKEVVAGEWGEEAPIYDYTIPFQYILYLSRKEKNYDSAQV